MIFSVGSFDFHLYGIIISLGILIGFFLTRKRAKLFKIPVNQVEDIYLFLIPTCLVGARAYHVLHQWSYYSRHLGEIIAIWQGGLGIYGAIIGGIIALYIYSRIKKQSFLAFFDLLAPSILLSQAIGRLGNFFNQEAFGPPTNLPWKIYISPEKRPVFWQNYDFFHPLFLYESLLILIGFFILLRFARPATKGLALGGYLVIYGNIRLLTEIGRIDTWQVSGLKVAQILSIFSIIGGTYLIRRLSKTTHVIPDLQSSSF